MATVKQHDFDNYLAGLLLPKMYRGCFFTVRAFHVELALIKEQSRKNVMTGRVRFQFWRDIIEKAFNKDKQMALAEAANTPVAKALTFYATEFNLSPRYFERALDARQQELNIQQQNSLDDMEEFSENAHSSMLYILLNMYDANDEDISFAASHVGVCSGMVTQLRGMAHLAGQGEIMIPKETMLKHGLTSRPIFHGPSTPEELKVLQEAVFDVASQANGHLNEARKIINPSSSIFKTRPGFLALTPAVRSHLYLEDLRKADFNPFHTDLLAQLSQPNQLHYQANLLKMKWTNKI